MLRHLATSWLFAGFLVVVAVATWRVLDVRSVDVSVPPPVVVAKVPEVPEVPEVPAVPQAEVPDVSGCGAKDAEDRRTDVQIGTQPFADTYIDGVKFGSTPFYGPRKLTLTVGKHDLEFRDKASGKWFRYRMELGEASDNKVVIVLDEHLAQQPRVTGQVVVTPVRGRVLGDARARELFSDAVDKLRDKDTKGGCRLLERIADQATSDSRWKEKAENLYSRRCDDL